MNRNNMATIKESSDSKLIITSKNNRPKNNTSSSRSSNRESTASYESSQQQQQKSMIPRKVTKPCSNTTNCKLHSSTMTKEEDNNKTVCIECGANQKGTVEYKEELNNNYENSRLLYLLKLIEERAPIVLNNNDLKVVPHQSLLDMSPIQKVMKLKIMCDNFLKKNMSNKQILQSGKQSSKNEIIYDPAESILLAILDTFDLTGSRKSIETTHNNNNNSLVRSKINFEHVEEEKNTVNEPQNNIDNQNELIADNLEAISVADLRQKFAAKYGGLSRDIYHDSLVPNKCEVSKQVQTIKDCRFLTSKFDCSCLNIIDRRFLCGEECECPYCLTSRHLLNDHPSGSSIKSETLIIV